MFDYHLHSNLSFDSECPASDIVSAAEKAGLKEICFTDHYDFNDDPQKEHNLFTIPHYRDTYDNISSPTVTIKRGVEFGLTPWNQSEAEALLSSYDFDFVIGSVHYTGGFDPYFKDFWEQGTVDECFEKYLLQTLECVKQHKNFDVLGHLNYVCKYNNPTNLPLYYGVYSDICDEIMKTLVYNGNGMEINTSGINAVGNFLPSADYIKRFRELGGEIITVGSDAHDGSKVGQHINGALKIAYEVFGYVCTFEKRKVKFNKL